MVCVRHRLDFAGDHTRPFSQNAGSLAPIGVMTRYPSRRKPNVRHGRNRHCSLAARMRHSATVGRFSKAGIKGRSACDHRGWRAVVPIEMIALQPIPRFGEPSSENGRIAGEIKNLVGPDAKRLQDMRPERVDEGNIGRVTAACDNDPANARHIVARVERPPSAGEEYLDPRAPSDRRPARQCRRDGR